MSTASVAMNNASTAGLVAQPAYRRFVSDLRDPRCLPAVDAPEILALEAERRRLVAALEEAEANGGSFAGESYVAARTRALREGSEMPPEPPSPAEAEAAAQRRQQHVAAAEEALLRFGDVVCATVRAHPEWEHAARAQVQTALNEAAEAERQAEAARQRAQDAGWLVQHLERTAADELYIARVSESAESLPDWLHIEVTDPHIADLIARSRSGQPI